MGENEEICKSYEEWKILINDQLSSDEFQNLCREILKVNKFINVRPRGPGGDGMRDIEAELDNFVGNERLTKKCWAQCKNYSKGTSLNYGSFSTDVNKAQNNHVEEFLVMSNKDLSPAGKTDICEWNTEKNICKIRDWTGDLFLDYLFAAPMICKRFFPDEPVLQIATKENPKKAIKILVNFGENLGIELNLQTNEEVNEKNPFEVGKILKKILLDIRCDDGQKILIYQKSSFIFLGLGLKSEGLFFLDKALDLDDENVEVLLSKGYLLGEMGEREESNKVYDDILEIDENNIAALNNKALNLFRDGELEESLEILERCLALDRKFIPAIKNKIKVLLAMRELEKALTFLDENEFAFEKSINLMIEKANLLLEKLDLKKAFEINEEILKRAPENLPALNNKGAIYDRNSRYQLKEKYLGLALEVFEEIIKKDKNYPLGWSNKTVMLINSSRLDDAENVIEIAHSMFPNSPDVQNKKGVVMISRGKSKKAIKYFDSALKRSYRGEFLLNRAIAKLNINHYPDALRDVEKLLRNEPKNSKAWAIKGECLRKLRKPFWEKALRFSREYAERAISLLEEEKNETKTD